MDPAIVPIDAKVTISLQSRNMAAVMTALPPQDGGQPLCEEMILDALTFRGITTGLDQKKIRHLVKSPVYKVDFIIARGQPPRDGTDGSLAYLFSQTTTLRPKELPDGTVDYRELGLIQHVEAGQLLVAKTPPTDGEDGYDVLGKKLRARRGRDPKMPIGKNTVVSEDGLQLFASAAGHVDVVGGKVTVQDTYLVKSDVSNATGNINFSGNVTVRGNVLAGFTVEAEGDIQVLGSCENCTLIAGGNITIGEGVTGGSITCQGELRSKYLQNCRIEAGARVSSGSLIGCTLHCGGSLKLQGPRGSILGGTCVVRDNITAMYIGSQNSYVPTRLEIGLDPMIQKRLQELPQEIDHLVKLLDNLDRVINLLEQYAAAQRLDQEKALQLQNAWFTRDVESRRLSELRHEQEELIATTKNPNLGSIAVKGTISPGVKIVIGDFKASIREPHIRCRICLGSDGIEIKQSV